MFEKTKIKNKKRPGIAHLKKQLFYFQTYVCFWRPPFATTSITLDSAMRKFLLLFQQGMMEAYNLYVKGMAIPLRRS